MRKFKDVFFAHRRGVMIAVVLMLALAFVTMSAGCAAQAVMQNQAPVQGSTENPAAPEAIAEAPKSEPAAAVAPAAAPVPEAKVDAPAPAAPEAPQSNIAEASPASSAAAVTAEQAKEIALAHAALTAADVTFLRAELDRDDGVQVYDIEFYKDNMEYDYEIDAATGSIRSFDHDLERHKPQAAAQSPAQAPEAPAQPSGNAAYIGVDKAKSIALAHAGLSPSEVVFKKAKLENDDGRTEYEIEFYQGRVEYEYTIDASNGAILEYDSEYDD